MHTAAQPSHDWAASDPLTDFGVNANGTLNLLEATRRHCPGATFVFTSTNKVYGDTPNRLPLVELETRLELPADHRYFGGIDTSMTIDDSMHSLFGVSKVAADLMVQEYGRYFDMPTVCFRAGCLTGPNHAGAMLHGFLSYLMRCTVTGEPYTIFGYDGRQVRDNIHSADLVRAFEAVHRAPRPAAVYNIGGGRYSNCSMIEAIALCEEIAGRRLEWTLSDQARMGDHRWWISDLAEFQPDYPDWEPEYDLARSCARSTTRTPSAGAPRREALGGHPRPRRGGLDRRTRSWAWPRSWSAPAWTTRSSWWTTTAPTAPAPRWTPSSLRGPPRCAGSSPPTAAASG